MVTSDVINARVVFFYARGLKERGRFVRRTVFPNALAEDDPALQGEELKSSSRGKEDQEASLQTPSAPGWNTGYRPSSRDANHGELGG